MVLLPFDKNFHPKHVQGWEHEKKKKEPLDVQIGNVLLTKLKNLIGLALPAYFLK